jgi:hypothetical protein
MGENQNRGVAELPRVPVDRSRPFCLSGFLLAWAVSSPGCLSQGRIDGERPRSETYLRLADGWLEETMARETDPERKQQLAEIAVAFHARAAAVHLGFVSPRPAFSEIRKDLQGVAGLIRSAMKVHYDPISREAILKEMEESRDRKPDRGKS